MKNGLIVLVAFAAFTGCSGNDSAAFCDAAEALATFDHRTADADEVNRLVNDLVETAPGEIEDSAQTFGEGIEALTSGNFDEAADPKFREASIEIEEYAEDHCGETREG